jgi:uncharacterized protein (DUF2147 family)
VSAPSFLISGARAALVATLATLTSAGATTGAWAQAAPKPHLTGFWQAYFDDGNPSGWFYFTEKNGLYEGRLVKMFKKQGETSLVQTCTACTGEKKNKPMLGLVIVYNLKRHDNKFVNGSILDPRDGNVYSAEAEVTPDGEKLLLRGYLGFELFGQTQTWTRLPDDSMAAADIPGEPVAPKAKPAHAKARGAAHDKAHAEPQAKPPEPQVKPQDGAPDATQDAAPPAQPNGDVAR